MIGSQNLTIGDWRSVLLQLYEVYHKTVCTRFFFRPKILKLGVMNLVNNI